jgi:CP family cyanate transporter-like MFS transporter
VTSEPARAAAGVTRTAVIFALLWLAGAGMRLTILAVPPVLPLIHAELGLTATEIGLLASLPVALFALAALPGSLLVAKLGTRTTLIGGLAIVALGSALRALSANATQLYATTILMGSGVAILQPTLPAIVRQWQPQRIAFATAIYTNGLIIGEIVPVMLTLSLVLPLAGDWRRDLAIWSVPVALTALLVALLAPRGQAFSGGATAPSARWWPDWQNPLIWRLGLLFGCINSLYFGINAFLPDFLNEGGRGALIGPSLTAFNFGQLPASLLLLPLAHRSERRAWPYLVAALLALASLAGVMVLDGQWMVLAAGVVGFAVGGSFILGLTLPPLLSAPDEVAMTSAAVFTLSYAGAVAVAILSGAMWDLSGVPTLVFAPMLLAALGLVAAALLLRRTGGLK